MQNKIDEEANLLVRYLYFKSPTEAARTLERLKVLKGKGEYSAGRFHALQGIYNAAQRNDRDSLFLKICSQYSVDEVLRIKNELARGLRSPVIDSFDRGFFEQWLQIIDQVVKLRSEKPSQGFEASSPR
ncbi:MAG: hypothetical protein QXK12_05595 [Candidatus Nezhaarchaeales archaeon]